MCKYLIYRNTNSYIIMKSLLFNYCHINMYLYFLGFAHGGDHLNPLLQHFYSL